jgi:hypothetical protein
MAVPQEPKERKTGKPKRTQGGGLRLRDQKTRIRGMNVAMEAAREYLKASGRPRFWPGKLARLVDANLRLSGQHIIVRVMRLERAGDQDGAERLFSGGDAKGGHSLHIV